MNTIGGGLRAASRHINFACQNSTAIEELVIAVHLPEMVDDGIESGVEGQHFKCKVEFIGIDIPDYTAFGADAVQALQLALDFDKILLSQRHRFSFYFVDGEPYFDGT